NAVAAKERVQRDVPVIIVDAGSAVTVDLVDATHAFRGGAIFPGLRLMAQALHDYTALLPLIESKESNPILPGTSTPDAMAAGIFWAVAGGVKALVRQLETRSREMIDPYHAAPEPRSAAVFLTGGGARLPSPTMDHVGSVRPRVALPGRHLTADAPPLRLIPPRL